MIENIMFHLDLHWLKTKKINLLATDIFYYYYFWQLYINSSESKQDGHLVFTTIPSVGLFLLLL